MVPASRNPSVSRDFILLFAVMMVMIALVAIWVAYKTFENYAQNVVSDMEGEALRIDHSLGVEIKSTSYLLESLARQIVQSGAENPENIAHLLRSFDDNNDHRNDEIAWINADQEVIVNSQSGVLTKVVNVSDRDYVKKALSAPWQVHIGRPLKARTNERWILPLSIGVTDYRGIFVGVLLVSIDIEALTKELAEFLQQSKMEFSIFTPTLTLITDSQTLHDDDIYERGKTTPLSQLDFKKQKKGVVSMPQLFNPYAPFEYYELSAHNPYVVYITYNQIARKDKIFSLLEARLVQILVIAVFLLSLLWMVRTRIIKPVEKLCEITAGISAGQAYRPLPKGGPVEIENLSNQIRKLADYIGEQHRIQGELHLKNQFLLKIKETSQAVSRGRTEFLMHVMKEIDGHLRSLIVPIEAIKEQRAGAIKQVKYVQGAAEALSRISLLYQMVRDVQAVVHLDYESQGLRESSVNIAFSLHRAVRQFHQKSQNRHIDIKLKAPDNLPVLIIDEERFTHIVVYLLCGAAATLTQGTPITITAQTEQTEAGNVTLVLSFRYASHVQPVLITDLPQEIPVETPAKQPFEISALLVRTEAISFAMARMLLSLYDAELAVNASASDTNRLFVRFPKNRLVLK